MLSTCGRAPVFTAAMVIAAIAIGCSGSPTQPSSPAPTPFPASNMGFTLLVDTGRPAGFAQASPMRVRLVARDGAGAPLAVTGGTLTARDGGGKLLSAAMIPASTGEVRVELNWSPADVVAHSLAFRIEVLDATGAPKTIEHTIAL
jgi:hypothetical protein